MVEKEPVVDIGSGAGFFLQMLKEKGKQGMGIEPNGGLRELARKIDPEVEVIAGTAEDIEKLIVDPVGTITMLDVLEHIERDDEQVKKIHRVLRPGGAFIFVVPAYPYLYGKRDEAMGHYRRYTKRGLIQLLAQNGFAVDSIRYWNALGVLPYAVAEKILRKPLRVRLREEGKKGKISEMLRTGLDVWMREFENRFDVGFGLSLICAAKKL